MPIPTKKLRMDSTPPMPGRLTSPSRRVLRARSAAAQLVAIVLAAVLPAIA
jgi:hypothetical protein